MTAFEVAMRMGLTIKAFEDWTSGCREIVEADGFVAVLKGNTVHLSAQIKGLGGRKVLKECRGVLARWLAIEPVLVAPVKHGNTKAVRIAEALGFRKYAETPAHEWLRLTRENFHVS